MAVDLEINGIDGRWLANGIEGIRLEIAVGRRLRGFGTIDEAVGSIKSCKASDETEKELNQLDGFFDFVSGTTASVSEVASSFALTSAKYRVRARIAN